jgi:hypothetical protein
MFEYESKYAFVKETAYALVTVVSFWALVVLVFCL